MFNITHKSWRLAQIFGDMDPNRGARVDSGRSSDCSHTYHSRRGDLPRCNPLRSHTDNA